MVERAEHEDDVGPGVGLREVAGVPDGGADPGDPGGVLHVLVDDVDEVDLVAGLRQPARVDTGAAADIEHPRRRGREGALEQLARPCELEPAVRRQAQPVVLHVARGVEAVQVGLGVVHGHRASMQRPGG